MAIFLMIFAGLLTGLSNLLMRRSIDAGGSTRAYLVVQLIWTFLVAILLNPVRTGSYAVSLHSVALGLIAGLILGAMLWSVGRALENGPPGITFAMVNSATVMPGIVMALLFGAVWGHAYSGWHALGSVLVVAGLFWAGWEREGTQRTRSWIYLAMAAFTAHVLLLAFLQWRALLIEGPFDRSWLVPMRFVVERGYWFMPAMYLAATTVQLCSYFRHERRWPNGKEMVYGTLGGVLQAGATFLLIRAPEIASPIQNAMIFPVFAVTIIIVSNLWAQTLYKERINWVANGVCLGGLVIGTIDWTVFAR